jgi:hypothetical protein
MLAAFGEFPWVKLTPHDVLLLREEAYEITSGGEVKLKGDRFVRMDTNLKFIAKTAARALEFEYELDTKGEGWQGLLATFAIRNRLVHPKAAADLIVTDEEVRTVMSAQNWFQTIHLELWNRINAGLKGTAKK